jgi:hypothetical protein
MGLRAGRAIKKEASVRIRHFDDGEVGEGIGLVWVRKADDA